MNLSPAQGRLLFAVIVLALVGLGAFLLYPHRPAAHPAASPTPRGATPVVSASPGATLQATTPPAASPPPTPFPATPAVNIYHLLPFSQTGLDQAVGVTGRFAAAYGTYSYHLDTAGYVATMRGLITPALATTLARGYATPGVVAQRRKDKQVATATASVTGLRAFGSSSLTLVVKLAQTISGTAGTSSLTTAYAVTVTLVHGRWEVSDIQLASAGNS